MAAIIRRAQILQELQEAVIESSPERARALACQAVQAGIDPCEVMLNGLAPGMERVGELVHHDEYFLPEVMMCRDAFQAGLEILQRLVKKYDAPPKRGRVLIGTIEGDLHDIGKNLVKVLLESQNFAVRDLGVGVAPARFVQQALRYKPHVVCISATLTTARPAVMQAIDALRLMAPEVKIVIGGAALSDSDARAWGADGYASEAFAGLREACQLMKVEPTTMNENVRVRDLARAGLG